MTTNSYIFKSIYVDRKAECLQRQLWIINYYVRSSSNSLSNENKDWCFQRNDNYFKNNYIYIYLNIYLLLSKAHVTDLFKDSNTYRKMYIINCDD